MPTYEEIIIAEIGTEALAAGLLGAGEGDYREITMFGGGSPEPVGGWYGVGSGRSLNSGCGFLEYTRDNTLVGQVWWGPFTVILEATFPAFMYTPYWPPFQVWNALLLPARLDKSYILEVAAGLNGAGERSCYRLEMTVDSDASWQPWLFDWINYDLSEIRHTPLGAMNAITYDKTDCALTLTSDSCAFPNITDKYDHDFFFPALSSCAKYSDVVMFQCYTVQLSQQYRTKVSYGSSWVYVDDPAMFTQAQIAIDYNIDIASVNPKNQTRIAALEAKVIEAMNAAAAEAGDEKCIDSMAVTIRE